MTTIICFIKICNTINGNYDMATCNVFSTQKLKKKLIEDFEIKRI